MDGLSYKEIAARRSITISTVKTHLDRSFKKMKCHSSLQLKSHIKCNRCWIGLRDYMNKVSELAAVSARYNTIMQDFKLFPTLNPSAKRLPKVPAG